jgi:hypothetical protein
MFTPSPNMSSPSINMDADAVHDAFVFGRLRVALGHQLLNRHCAFNRVDDRGKLQQQPVAHRLDDPPAARRHDWPRRVAMLAHRSCRTRLILAHQARIADDVGGHDRSEFAGLGHCVPKAEKFNTRRASERRSNRAAAHVQARSTKNAVRRSYWPMPTVIVSAGPSGSRARSAGSPDHTSSHSFRTAESPCSSAGAPSKTMRPCPIT